MSESLWAPKRIQILGLHPKFWDPTEYFGRCTYGSHLQLGRDIDGEGRMFSSTSTFQQHLLLTRWEEKETETTLGWKIWALRRWKCWAGAMRSSRAALTPSTAPLQHHPCGMGLLGAQGALLCLQKCRFFGKSQCSKQPLPLPGSAGLETGEFWKILYKGVQREPLMGTSLSSGLHLLAAASSNKANIWCQKEL